MHCMLRRHQSHHFGKFLVLLKQDYHLQGTCVFKQSSCFLSNSKIHLVYVNHLIGYISYWLQMATHLKKFRTLRNFSQCVKLGLNQRTLQKTCVIIKFWTNRFFKILQNIILGLCHWLFYKISLVLNVQIQARKL